jgi:hypothetical protein
MVRHPMIRWALALSIGVGALLKSISVALAATYWISAGLSGPTCSDSYTYTQAQSSATPWCTAAGSGTSHTVQSVDTIMIYTAGGAYNEGTGYFNLPAVNYTSGRATLTADVCLQGIITGTSASYGALQLTQSHWTIKCLNVSNTNGPAILIQAFPSSPSCPSSPSPAPIDDEITNNIIGPAILGGIATVRSTCPTGTVPAVSGTVPTGTPTGTQPTYQYSADYQQWHDNVVFNAAAGNSSTCPSNIDAFGLMDYDNHSSYHGYYTGDFQHPIWIYHNLIYGNTGTAHGCDGSSTSDSDGNGLIIDNLCGCQEGHLPVNGTPYQYRTYTGNIVFEGNVVAGVDGACVQVFHMSGAPYYAGFGYSQYGAHASIRNNVCWHNLQNPYYANGSCAELHSASSNDVHFSMNIAVPATGALTNCAAGVAPYGFADPLFSGTASDGIVSNSITDSEQRDWLYSPSAPSGAAAYIYSGTTGGSITYSLGSTTVTTTNPTLVGNALNTVRTCVGFTDQTYAADWCYADVKQAIAYSSVRGNSLTSTTYTGGGT